MPRQKLEQTDPERAAERDAKKVEAFVNIASRRTNNVIEAIDSLRKTANRTNYAYSDEQVSKIREAVDGVLAECWEAFATGQATGKGEFHL